MSVEVFKWVSVDEIENINKKEMSKIERFEDLKVWQRSRVLVRKIYLLSNQGALKTDFGFRDQLRRCSLSIMNNIAEGFGRHSRKEFIRFLDFSVASATEAKSMIYLAEDISYLETHEAETIKNEIDEVRSMIYGLIRHHRAKSA